MVLTIAPPGMPIIQNQEQAIEPRCCKWLNIDVIEENEPDMSYKRLCYVIMHHEESIPAE